MQIYTLSTAHPELGGVDFDLAVENDVFPLDWADVPDGFGIEREVGRGGDPGDFPGLPVDDAGEDQRQARTRVHLVVDLTGADAYTARTKAWSCSTFRSPLRTLARSCGSDMHCKAEVPVDGVEAVEPLKRGGRVGVPGTGNTAQSRAASTRPFP